MGRTRCAISICFLFLSLPALAGYTNFEASHVHPIDLTPSGQRLLAVNTPDALLEVFSVGANGALVHERAIPVGLEPTTVIARSDSEAWVVNQLSDSVSIVDLDSGLPLRTLHVGNEPSDVAFAAGRAFIAVSGEDALYVYDLARLDAAPVRVELFSRKIRALAVSNDGTRVYAVPLQSGNQTTVVHAKVALGHGPLLRPEVLEQMGLGGIECEGAPPPPRLPLPEGITRNPTLTDPPPGEQPATSIIVRWNEGEKKWLDEADQDWSHCLRFRLPDEDLFEISAADLTVRSVSHLGTSLFEVSVNPANGRIYVPNTDARNFVRFEHPLGLEGHVVDNRMSIVDPANANTVVRLDLNAHIDRASKPETNLAERQASISQAGMMAWEADGSHAWITGLGSRKVFRVDASCMTKTCVFGPDRANPAAVEVGDGPTGVALRESATPGQSRLYVLNRVSHSISIVDPVARTLVGEVELHDPSNDVVRIGRHFLYDAIDTSAHGDAACSSCHLSGDHDGLAWELGNPEGDFIPYDQPYNNLRKVVHYGPFIDLPECLPADEPCVDHAGFDPQKGPAVTQTFRGMLEPLHHRGDRPTFRDFNSAFVTLLGAPNLNGNDRPLMALSSDEMALFRQYALNITYPPNPHRLADDTTPCGPRSSDPGCEVTVHGSMYPGNPTEGRLIFIAREVMKADQPAGLASCKTCHTTFFGSGGGVIGGVHPTVVTSLNADPIMNGRDAAFDLLHNDTKVPHLRNVYERMGPTLAVSNAVEPARAKSGFGFGSDGAIPDLFRLISSTDFFAFEPASGQQQARDVASFLLHFSTGTKPSVGRHVTVPPGAAPTGSAADEALINTLVAVGDIGNVHRHCELTASTVVGGAPVHYFFLYQKWHADAGEMAEGMTMAAMRQAAEGPLTFLCAPLGSGLRLGYDRDEDNVPNGLDCAPGDDETVGTPLAIAGLEATATTWSWYDQLAQVGPSVRYDVLGGTIDELHAVGLGASVCVASGLQATMFTDERPNPVPGAGYFYLMRAVNPCGGSPLGGGLDQLECD